MSNLPSGIVLENFNPAFEETDILEQMERVANSKPAALFLVCMHGGYARQLVLAGRKSRLPTVIWCHDKKHSLSSSLLAVEALQQLGHPHILIHNDTPAAVHEVAMFSAAATARQRLSEARIGQLGHVHFNLISASVNPLIINARFGAWVVPLSLSILRSKMAEVSRERINAEITAFRSRYYIKASDDILEKAMAMHLAIKDIVSHERLDAIAVDCWNEVVTEFGVSPCLGFCESSYRIACEGDLITAVTLIAGESISGNTGFVGDLYSLDEKTGETLIIHCAGCASLHSFSKPMAIASHLSPDPYANLGSVVACQPLLSVGPATIVLLHGANLEQLHLRRCEIIRTEFPEQMQVYIRIEGKGKDFLCEAAGNHYIVFPGDYFDAWLFWAKEVEINVH